MTNATGPVTQGFSLEGRRVLVTGAGKGIGRGVASELAALGAAVAINDISADAAQRAADEIVAAGGIAVAAAGNITDPAVAESVIDAAVAGLGGLDGLVNNAGITGVRDFEKIGREDWDRVIDLNLSTPFHLSVLATPHLRRSPAGRIINISSIAGTRISVLGGAAYTASKAGLIGLTRHLAMELAEDGITVNAILPGVTVTPLVRSHTSVEKLAEIERSVPLGRAGQPEDVGWMVSFLMNERSSYVTGTATEVDGGMTVLPGDFTSYRSARSNE